MAQYGKSFVVPQLPGAVLITDPAWKILAMSPLAITLLNMPTSGIMQFDFTQLLEPTEKHLIASGEEFTDFQLHLRVSLKARQSAVTDTDGKLVLRLITLGEPAAD